MVSFFSISTLIDFNETIITEEKAINESPTRKRTDENETDINEMIFHN